MVYGMKRPTLIHASGMGSEGVAEDCFAILLSSSGVYIPFHFLAARDELAAGLQSASLAQVTDGLGLVQTCFGGMRINLGAKVSEQLSVRFEACCSV